MNSANQEIGIALSLLIKKNPIVDITLKENVIEIVYLNKTIESIPFQINENNEFDYDGIKEALTSYIDDKITNQLTNNIEANKEEQTNDFSNELEKLKEYIDLQLKFLKEQPPQQTIEQHEHITKIEEKYDDSELKSWVQKLLDDIEPNVVENHHHHKETINEYIDYNYIKALINDAIEKFKSTSPQRYITSIEQYFGDAIIVYNDGTKQNISDILAPSVTVVGGGMGGGSGPRGYSAYQIAVQYGFKGSEQQWLDSLKGGYSPPENGQINYNNEGQIESIVVGSATTTFNRNVNGDITSIDKEDYTKDFIRDDSNRIQGWTITHK